MLHRLTKPFYRRVQRLCGVSRDTFGDMVESCPLLAASRCRGDKTN